MKKSIMAAAVIVIVAIAAVGVGVYLATQGGGGGVANATSLQYNSEVSYQGAAPNLFNCAAKNIGATDMMLRIDILGGEAGNYTYILNHGTQTAWMAVNGNWTDVSSDFTNQWNTWVGTGTHWTTDLDRLATNWSGTGDYTYTNSTTGTTVRYYNIVINPSLADSLFQHS